jgi:2-oxoglutarate ferredoxin oxidoreductase subunit alpha
MFGRNGESPVPIVAPHTPGDCFEAVIEATRIALRYRTPVLLLSDGAIANGSEPWLIPQVGDLPDLSVTFASEPNALDGSDEHWPYVRDTDTLARQWAIPGTPGLQHRIGGLEKADGKGSISYDPDNHDRMVRLRQAKIDGIDVPDLEVDDPSGAARVLVLGWGSSFGPIGAGCRRVRGQGMAIAQAHLRNLNPFPANLGEVLRRYERVVLPEMNMGQLALLLRGKYLVDIQSYTKVAGLPFKAEELQHVFTEHVRAVEGVRA